MKIIAFSAKKQGGKTMAEMHLRHKLDEFTPLNFAGCLKELVFRYFAAPTKEYANTMYDPFTTEESKNTKHPCGKTYRELLQVIGTDMFRGLWPDIWIENYKFRAKIADEYPIITADVRFPNEVKCIQEMGGHVIRLLRAPFPEDRHESETALDYMELATLEYYAAECRGVENGRSEPSKFDAIIDNREMTIEEQNEAVWKLVTERNWI